MLYPGETWPTARPEDVGASSAKLRAINPAIIGDATLIISGHEIWTWGEAGARQTNTASCTRSFLTTAWLMAIQRGLIPGGAAVLDRPVRDLPSDRARTFNANVRLANLLSYTSLPPVGHRWSYSSGQHWYDQYQIFKEVCGMSVADFLNRELFPVLGGNLYAHTVNTLVGLVPVDETDEQREDREAMAWRPSGWWRVAGEDVAGEDLTAEVEAKGGETNRIYGSVRDLARWAYFFGEGQGNWNGRPLIDPALLARALGGGPDGTGYPEPREGWQIHKAYRETWSDGQLPGVPDDCFFAAGAGDIAFIIAVPSLRLVVARQRGHGYNIGTWLGLICRAVQG